MIAAAMTAYFGYLIIYYGYDGFLDYVAVVICLLATAESVIYAIRYRESPEEAAERLRHVAQTQEIMEAAKFRHLTSRYPWV